MSSTGGTRLALKLSLCILAWLAVICMILSAGCRSVAITVNGDEINRAELDGEVDRRLTIIEKNSPEELRGERADRLKEETRRDVATELVRNLLIEQEAAELGVNAPREEVDRRLEEERSREGFDDFKKKLKEQGLNEEQHGERVKENVLLDEVAKKICGEVLATEDEVESYYLTHKDLFSVSTMVHVAHILTDTEGQARIVVERIESGEDFDTLARSLSIDQATRNNGGDLGWIERGTMEPAFEEAAFSMKTGQVSGVVKALDGYHVLKVLERREARIRPYDEVKNEAATVLVNRKKEELFSDWLRTVYANAEVEVHSGIGRWDPSLGMIVE